MVAEFQLKVESSIAVAVNGRTIESGAAVPADGSYRVDMRFPVFIPAAQIAATIDDDLVADAVLMHPTAEDSLAWTMTFRRKLSGGTHRLKVTAGAIEFNYRLVVSNDTGLRSVLNYPNPFRAAGTTLVYSNEVEIIDGSIDIFTQSGKRVRHLDIPPGARLPGQNSVFWDGRDTAGGSLANGVYLYVIKVNQRGGSATVRGAMSKIE
jgi:Arc/MetJ family transcription regulator